MHTVLKCFHWPSRPPSSTSKYSWTRMPASDMSATWAVSSRSSMGAGVEARAVGCISGPACDAGATKANRSEIKEQNKFWRLRSQAIAVALGIVDVEAPQAP